MHNLKFTYNIEGTIRHTNDLTSVTSWVEEMGTQKYNPVLVFKQQGNEQPENIDNVVRNDFLLGMQTEFQRDMLVKFSDTICGHNTWYKHVRF